VPPRRVSGWRLATTSPLQPRSLHVATARTNRSSPRCTVVLPGVRSFPFCACDSQCCVITFLHHTSRSDTLSLAVIGIQAAILTRCVLIELILVEFSRYQCRWQMVLDCCHGSSIVQRPAEPGEPTLGIDAMEAFPRVILLLQSNSH
jgi:hypothetical protein